MCIATVTGVWIERHFVQTIIHEDQTAVGDSEFGNTNRLRSEVKSDQARRSGHGVKALNRNYQMPKQISTAGNRKQNHSIGQKSAGAPAHSKTQARKYALACRPRLGVRRCCAAFGLGALPVPM